MRPRSIADVGVGMLVASAVLSVLAAGACGTGARPGPSLAGTKVGSGDAGSTPVSGKAALDASLAQRPEGALFVTGTRLAFGASDASPAVLLRCEVTAVDDRDHWRLATVTCDAPAPAMALVPRVAGTYVATVDGLWHFDQAPTSDAALTAETMLLPTERYATYLRDPAGDRTWFQRTYAGGSSSWPLWCTDRVTKTSFDSWCIGQGTIIQAVTVADPTGRAMYTARDPGGPAVRAPATAAAIPPTAAPLDPLERAGQACTRGHALSCLRAATLLDQRAATEAAATAAATYDRAMSQRLTGCELGVRAACYAAAVQLRTRRGIAADDELAGRLTQLSCSDGLCGARFEDLIADHEASAFRTLFTGWLADRGPLATAGLGIVELTLIVNHRDVIAHAPWTLRCKGDRAGVATQVSVDVPKSTLEYEAAQVWSTIISPPAGVTLGECIADHPERSLGGRLWIGVRGAPARRP